MIRVYIVVEGRTEAAFVKQVLAPELAAKGIYAYACLIGRPGQKGGVISYARAKRDIIHLLKQEADTYCTTMFDFFRLPRDFPGMPNPTDCPMEEKARRIERALYEDIACQLGNKWNQNRFIPYIQMHEYEALLFSAPESFAEAIGQASLSQALSVIRHSFRTPEDIDDGPETAPSKRIIRLYGEYDKPLHGTLAAMAIGLSNMRSECRHFNEWIGKLEELVPAAFPE